MTSFLKKSIHLSFGLLAFLCLSCGDKYLALSPKLDFAVQDKYLQSLKPIFPPLTTEELKTPWGLEYQIGLAFAKKLDLFHAIASFKRADILIPDSLFQRKSEIQYHIINTYYLGKKFNDVIDSFENSILANTNRNFAGFHDLLIILFEAYQKCDEEDRAVWILQTMKKFYPEEGKKLELTSHLLHANLKELSLLIETKPINKPAIEKTQSELIQPVGFLEEEEEIDETHINHCKLACKELIEIYQQNRKSPLLAQTLNALLPGAGYLYLGQKQSAFTAFTLNGLFIAAAGYFYYQDNIPAAIITLGFESGWYLGGIVGVAESAKLYNERIFETHAHHRMRDNKLYPVLMLHHGF